MLLETYQIQVFAAIQLLEILIWRVDESFQKLKSTENIKSKGPGMD